MTTSMTFLSVYFSHWWRQTLHAPIYFMVVYQSEARASTLHGIKIFTHYRVYRWPSTNDVLGTTYFPKCFCLFMTTINRRVYPKCPPSSRTTSRHFESEYRADSRFAPSQWETALLCNDVSHWLGANLESINPGMYDNRGTIRKC